MVFAQLPVTTLWSVRQHNSREENRLCAKVVVSHVGFRSSVKKQNFKQRSFFLYPTMIGNSHGMSVIVVADKLVKH